MRTIIFLTAMLTLQACAAQSSSGIWIQRQPANDGTDCYIAWRDDAVVGFSCTR